MGKPITQIVITVLSLFVMAQALFWPLIMKPGTQLEWWQNLYVAKVGQYVGFPVWVVLFNSPFEGTTQLVFAWFLITVWAIFIFWLSGAVLRLFRASRRREF